MLDTKYTATDYEIRYERPTPEALGIEFAEGFTSEDYVKQIDIEYNMRESRYAHAMEEMRKAAAAGEEATTGYGSSLVGQNIESISEALKVFAETKTKGRPHILRVFINEILPNTDVIAAHALTHMINGVSAVKQLSTISSAISRGLEDEVNYHILMRKHKGLATVTKEAIKSKKDEKHKRESLHWSITKAAEMDLFKLTDEQRVQLGNSIIHIVCQTTGLMKIEVKLESNGNNHRTPYYLVAQDNLMHWLEGARKELARSLQPVYAPMVVPPQKWSPDTIRRGGYITPANRPLSMIKTYNKGYLRELRTAGMESVYDALNRIQETPVQINKFILGWLDTFAEQGLSWSRDIKLPAFSALQIEDYCPRKPEGLADDDYRVKEYQKAAAEFYKLEAAERAKLLGYSKMVEMAREYVDVDRFFVPWQGDTRMRVYAASKLNFQGADYVKALCRFADGKKLGEHGMKWLMIHMANLFGVDKVSFEERVQWTLDHKEQIIALANDPRDVRDFWVTADKPLQALACADELARAWSLTCTSDFVSHLPIALDGSCSGLQILGAALRCEKTGEHVNLIPQDTVADIYNVVAMLVKERFEKLTLGVNSFDEAHEEGLRKARLVFLEAHGGKGRGLKPAFKLMLEKAAKGEAKFINAMRKAYYEVTEAYAWLQFGISRKTVKRNVMTYCYGSGQFGFKEQCYTDIIKPAYEKHKMLVNRGEHSVFPFAGKGNQAASLMASYVYPAVKETVLKAAEAMDWMQQAAHLIAAENAPVRWTTPLGFPVLQEYRVQKETRVQCTILGTVRKLTIKEDTLDYDKSKAKNAIAPNVVHSLDSTHLQMLVNLAYEKYGIKHFALIHDSFGTHAGNTEVFFKVIREAMVNMFSEHDIFKDLEEEFKIQCPPDKHEEFKELPQKGKLELEGILHSNFAFA